MSAVHSTSLQFAYPTVETARRVERSIRVEVGKIDDERSTVSLSQVDQTLTVAIEATDLVALRAGINSWLRYVSVAERVEESIRTDTIDESCF